MIEGFVDVLASWRRAGGALAWSGRSWSAQDILAEADRLAALPGRHLRVPAGDAGSQLAAMIAGMRTGAQVELAPLGTERSSGPRRDQPTGAGLVIYSSGSTGRPKPTLWRWERLLGERLPPAGEARCTLHVHFAPNSFAGVQGLLHGLVRARSIIFGAGADERRVGTADAAPLHIFATPTYWRRRLMAPATRGARVELVALGGEPADQALLTRLAELHPFARITHTYASTEQGSLFTVSDGLEGFPATLLDRPLASGRVLTVHDGELVVCHRGREAATGDLVARAGDRMLFRGRKSSLVEVGGRTVCVAEIEQRLRGIGGVGDVRVLPRPNAMVGHILLLEICAEQDADRQAVQQALRAAFTQRLEPHERPRHLRFVDRIEVAPSGKAALSPAAPFAETAA